MDRQRISNGFGPSFPARYELRSQSHGPGPLLSLLVLITPAMHQSHTNIQNSSHDQLSGLRDLLNLREPVDQTEAEIWAR